MRALMKTRAISSDSGGANFASAGRTDRFASAMGNAFAVNVERDLSPAEISSKLSDDVIVWARIEVPLSFNPRRALRRHYKYFIHFTKETNLDSLVETSKLFLGVHDFRRFAHRQKKESSIREITELRVSKLDSSSACISIVADSFLRRMVRKIVGVLIYVASGLLQPAEARILLDPEGAIPPMGVPSAPPENLVLWDVDYGYPFKVDAYAIKKLREHLTKSLVNLLVKKTMLEGLQELGETILSKKE